MSFGPFIRFLFCGIETERNTPGVAVPAGRVEMVSLAAIVVVAFALRAALPTFLPNIYHPDELFQYLEQGHRIAFGYGVVPWEYREGTRSWLLPGLLGGLMWLTTSLGGGVATYMTVIGSVLSAFSISVVVVAWSWARRQAGPTAAILAAVITATWFELVYFGSKPLTEAIAASTLFWGAYLFCGTVRISRGSALAAGILLGLTFALRIHLAPAILIVVIAGCYRFSIARGLVAVIGLVSVVIAAGMLDWATWDYPFQSFWRNIYVNIVENKPAKYGILPWYGYIGFYFLNWSGFILIFGILALAGARRAPLLLIVPLVVVASHTFIGHKELRFVFPALPFFLTLAAMGTADTLEAMKRAWPRLPHARVVAAAMLFWAVTSAVLMVGDGFRPNLKKNASLIAGFADLRNEDSICGVGLVNVPWYNTGGYTYLHRNVPLYVVGDIEEFAATQDAFNMVLAPPAIRIEQSGYRRTTCYGNRQICLYVRDGTCRIRPELFINQILIDRGQ